MKLIALGASDSVGASCYFVQIDGLNFLLDCGKGILKNRTTTFGPDFTPLFANGLTSLAQLDAIFLSHGHYDHIGYLPEVVQRCPDTPIYATYMTKKLGHYLMLDNTYATDNRSLEEKISAEFGAARILERIQPQNYLQPIQIGSVRITFYEAGHVPGAAMILLESPHEGTLLYTGDFRKAASRLTAGYILPSDLRPDSLLMCGLHAKHPGYVLANKLNRLIGPINHAMRRHQPCLIPTRELTKGIEIVSFLVENMDRGTIRSAPIFLDDYIWTLNERIQEVGISVLNSQCRRFPRFYGPKAQIPGIYVGGKGYRKYFPVVLETHFSLHADYTECSSLIQRLHPKNVILVHAPDDKWNRCGNTALEQEHPDTFFIYPQVGQPYDLF